MVSDEENTLVLYGRGGESALQLLFSLASDSQVEQEFTYVIGLSNESLLFIRFIFGLAYYYQTYFSNWVELSFRIRDECFIWLREQSFRGPVASIFQGLVIFLLDQQLQLTYRKVSISKVHISTHYSLKVLFDMVFTWYWAHIFSSDLVIILGGCIFSSWIWSRKEAPI